MEQTPQHPDEGAGRTASAASFDAGRRTLLRGGVGATPVLLTLASRPVSAAGATCVVASSFVSVASFRSRNPTTTSVKCTTRTCEDWLADANLPDAQRPAYLNNTVSSLLGTTTSPYNGTLITAVLQNAPGGIVTAGEIGVLQHIVSLTLSVQHGFAPLPGNLNAPYLQSVWQNFKNNNGRYVLQASGINWDSTQLISWLRVLMYPISI